MRTFNRRRVVAQRTATGILSVVLTTSLVSGVTAVAQPTYPSDSEIAAAQDAVTTAQNVVGSLAASLSSSDSEIANLEMEMGGLREAVNKALVDLHDAQAKAEQARQGVSSARANLDATQSEIEAAQAKLDDISRSAYRQGATAPGVGGVSGNANSEDSLDRQTYLRTTAEKQRQAIDDLDRLRTEQANEESRLREARNYAEQQEQDATQAQQDAQQAIDDTNSQLEDKQRQHDELVASRDQAQSNLDAAKANATNLNNQRDEFQAYQEAQAAKEKAEQEAAAAEAARQAAEAEAQKKAQEQAAAQAAADAAAQAEENQRLAAQKDAEEKAAAAAEAKADAEAQANNASQAQAAKDAAATAAGVAAAALVAASQADHASTADPYAGSDTTGANSTTSTSNPIAAVQSDEVANSGNSAVADLDTVKLESTDSVTQKASALVSDASADQKIEAVIARAKSQLGVPYAWGGGNANGPTKGIRDGGVADSYGDYNKIGFDCSGLVLYAFAGVGISLPHYTGYQYQRGTKISPSEMKRGDLIFYGPNAENHVAIYLGDGTMIEAPNSGSTVKISPVRWSGMSPYAVRLIG